MFTDNSMEDKTVLPHTLWYQSLTFINITQLHVYRKNVVTVHFHFPPSHPLYYCCHMVYLYIVGPLLYLGYNYIYVRPPNSLPKVTDGPFFPLCILFEKFLRLCVQVHGFFSAVTICPPSYSLCTCVIYTYNAMSYARNAILFTRWVPTCPSSFHFLRFRSCLFLLILPLPPCFSCFISQLQDSLFPENFMNISTSIYYKLH